MSELKKISKRRFIEDVDNVLLGPRRSLRAKEGGMGGSPEKGPQFAARMTAEDSFVEMTRGVEVVLGEYVIRIASMLPSSSQEEPIIPSRWSAI